jgi:hypothetical protein
MYHHGRGSIYGKPIPKTCFKTLLSILKSTVYIIIFVIEIIYMYILKCWFHENSKVLSVHVRINVYQDHDCNASCYYNKSYQIYIPLAYLYEI